MEVKGNMLSKRRIVADEPYVPLGQKMAYPLELQKVANTLLQYVTTGIVIMLVLAFIFFMIVGFGWVFFYENTAIGDYVSPLAVSSAFDVMNFIVALLIPKLFLEMMTRYSANPKAYIDILAHIIDTHYIIAVHVANSYTTLMSCPKCKANVLKLFHTCRTFNYLLLHLFRNSTEVLVRPYDKQFKTNMEHYAKDPLSQLQFTIAEIYLYTDALKENKLIDSHAENEIGASVEMLRLALNQTYKAHFYEDPPIFNYIIYAIMGFFVLCVVPLQLYAHGKWLTILGYPIVSSFFLGIPFISWWLGDAFSTHSRNTAFDSIKIRDEVETRMNEVEKYAFCRAENDSDVKSNLKCLHSF